MTLKVRYMRPGATATFTYPQSVPMELARAVREAVSRLRSETIGLSVLVDASPQNPNYAIVKLTVRK